MRKTKFLLAIFIVIAMIMSNCISIFKNMVFADGEIAIHFDTNTYTDKTATFKVGEENVTITISGTESTIHEDGDNCGIGFTEPLGSEVTIQVSDNFNQETMEIGAAGNDGFYHELTVDQNRFVIFSDTETDDMTGETKTEYQYDEAIITKDEYMDILRNQTEELENALAELLFGGDE